MASFSPVRQGLFRCSTALFLEFPQSRPCTTRIWVCTTGWRLALYLCSPGPALGLRVVAYLVSFPRKTAFWEDFPFCPQCPPPPQNRKFYFYRRLAVSDLPLALQDRAIFEGREGRKGAEGGRGVASKAGKKEKGRVKTSQELHFPAPPIENTKPPQRTLPY